MEREGVPGSANQGGNVRNAGDGLVPESPPRRWRPKVNWASFRLRRKEEAASTAQGVEAASDQRVEAVADQGAGVVRSQGAEAPAVRPLKP